MGALAARLGRGGGRPVYVVVARYYTQEGADDEVAAILRGMIPVAAAEPGCEHYDVNRSTADPRRFLLYERYRDEAGYQAHLASEPVQTHIFGRVVPLLESREREFYAAIDPA